jgi:vacuolar protein 8
VTSLGVFDVLIPLTESESIEVQGNSAAALGNLSSKGKLTENHAPQSPADVYSVGDYSIFMTNWSSPSGGIHGYLSRFLASGDPTFQHIAIWTLLQLLESNDTRLVSTINSAEDVMQMVQDISERQVESDNEDGSEDGEAEVVGLARRCLEISSGDGNKKALSEG